MYYYKVKENSVIENMMAEDKKAIDRIFERADKFCEKYGFKASVLVTYPFVEIIGFKHPQDNTDLNLFKNPNSWGEYIPKKRFKSVHNEFQAIGRHRRYLTSFIYANSEPASGQRELTWGNNKKPFIIGYSHKLNQDIIDDNLIEITKSEFMKRKEEE